MSLNVQNALQSGYRDVTEESLDDVRPIITVYQ